MRIPRSLLWPLSFMAVVAMIAPARIAANAAAANRIGPGYDI